MTCLQAINFVTAAETAIVTQRATYLASLVTNNIFPTGTTGENIGLSAYCDCNGFSRGDVYHFCGVDSVGMCPPCGCCQEVQVPVVV